MVDQTQMNGRTGSQRASTAMRAHAAGLLNDVIALAELQLQLFAVDLREACSRSVVPVVLMLGGGLLALGTVPVLLLSISRGLINIAGLSEGAAFLSTGVAALGVGVAMGWIGWLKFNSALRTLSRSQQELSGSVRWIKRALNRRGSPP